MRHGDFQIGTMFASDGHLFRCTDVGSRTIIAIRVDEVEMVTKAGSETTSSILPQAAAEAQGWFNGPPYGVAELVFDEDDLEGCAPV